MVTYERTCDVKMAMGNQSAQGLTNALANVAACDAVYPLYGGAPFGIRKELEALGGADGLCSETKVRENLEYAEFSFEFPLIPDLEAYIEAFIYTLGSYGQPTYHTQFWDLGSVLYKLADVVCTGWTLTAEAGRPPVLVVDMRAITTRDGSDVLLAGEAITAVPDVTMPYEVRETKATWADAGAQTASTRMKRIEFRVERNMVSAMDGARITDSRNPQEANATGLPTVTVRLTDDFRDALNWTDFFAATYKEIAVVMTSGANVMTWTAPRCAIWDITADVPADRQAELNNTLELRGLGSTDGVTAPFVLS